MRISMLRSPRFAACTAAVVLGLTLRANATTFVYTAAGVYDAVSNANIVDVNASGAVIASPAATDYAGFSANIVTAFATGNGGVVQFDLPTLTVDGVVPTVTPANQITTAAANNGVSPAPDTLSASFALGAKSLALTSGVPLKVAQYGSATPLSGSQELDIGDLTNPTNTGAAPEGQQSFVINFGAITGGAAGEAVTSVGLTALSRNASTVGMFVTYSDGTVGTALSSNLPGGNAAADTFYGFVAPAGLSIASLSVSRSTRLPFDDLGFITSVVTPEPASMGLLLAGGTMLTRRRRGR